MGNEFPERENAMVISMNSACQGKQETLDMQTEIASREAVLCLCYLCTSMDTGMCGSQKLALFFLDYSPHCFMETESLTKTGVCRSDRLVG